MNASIAKILATEPAAVAACVAIAAGLAPDARGFERAARCGFADYNRWDGYSLTGHGRQIVAAAGAPCVGTPEALPARFRQRVDGVGVERADDPCGEAPWGPRRCVGARFERPGPPIALVPWREIAHRDCAAG